MDTDQIMDLFSLGNDEAPVAKTNGPVSSKQAIEGLEQLWSEDQYDDFVVDDFLAGLKGRQPK